VLKAGIITLGLTGLLAVGGTQQKPPVTYTEKIAPIFAKKCLPCHGASKTAPFDFSTYESVKSRIELIRTQVLSKNMPPIWVHSDYGNLSTIDQVTDEEAVDFQRWIQAGMPKGAKVDEGSKGWTITRKPSLSLDYKSQAKVKREGIPYWKVSTIPLPSKGGEFNSFILLPSSPIAFRSALIAIVPKSMKVPTETYGSLDLPAQYLVGVWAPGYRQWYLPPGLTHKFPANSKLVVQMHLRPTGKVESANFKFDFYKLGNMGKKQPQWISAEKKSFVIQAGKSVVYELNIPVKRNLSLLTILPEARFYAGRVQLIYSRPGAEDKTVFDCMRWDPYWQGNYSPEAPIKLAAGGTLIAKFYYNNDENCRMNEGRKIVDVKEGPTASDEVCRMHLLVEP
jgi:hypothetical protein